MGISEGVRIAVVGAGHWGPNLIRHFHSHPRSRVTWVSDLDTARLGRISAAYPGIRTTPDWEVVLGDDTDAVVVSTPTASHAAIARRALEMGKHVFVEKPSATTLSEATALAELAEDLGLKLMTGHVFLFNPALHKMKEILDSGQLGRLLHLYSTRINHGPIRTDVNALWDLAPHDISMVLYLLGRQPERVEAEGTRDSAFATLYFDGGPTVNLRVSWLAPKKVRQFVLVGTRNLLVFDDLAPEGRREPLADECDAFVRYVCDDEPQPSDGRFGAEVVRVLERISAVMRPA